MNAISEPTSEDTSDDDTEYTMNIRAHLENAAPFMDRKHTYAISDGGADSCVVGRNAYIA